MLDCGRVGKIYCKWTTKTRVFGEGMGIDAVGGREDLPFDCGKLVRKALHRTGGVPATQYRIRAGKAPM